MITVSYDLTGIDDIAKLIVAKCKHKIILFNGDMGAGKTTLIKSVCKYLGVEDTISSPTFSLVNEYEGNDSIIFHFDFYRIKDQDEAYALGFEEYEYNGDFLFIEWGERIPDLIPDDVNIVDITVESNGLRTLSIR